MLQMRANRLQHRRCAGAPPRRRTAAAAGDKAAALADLKQSQDGLTSHLEGVEKGMKAEARSSAPAPLDSYDETDLEEIYIENYHQRIKEADSPVVCVDFYTKWCGPCKIIYPKLVEMKETHAGEVTFYRVNCNKSFKDLGTELGIKVAPTFIFYKGGEQVKMITGAKLDGIRETIAELTA